MEVYTISGHDDSMYGPPTAAQTACAKQSAPLFIAGAGTQLLSAPVALFGTYKLFKNSTAAGLTGLIAGIALFFTGRRLVQAAAATYERCVK